MRPRTAVFRKGTTRSPSERVHGEDLRWRHDCGTLGSDSPSRRRPAGLTVEDPKRDHPSRPRNPIIAAVFYRHGLVEKGGRGTQKIMELCVAAGRPSQ